MTKIIKKLNLKNLPIITNKEKNSNIEYVKLNK